MLDFNQEELIYQYRVNRKVMKLEYLYRLIDLLIESNDRLIKTMEDITNDDERQRDKEPTYNPEDYRD